jgi:hypothetical protein
MASLITRTDGIPAARCKSRRADDSARTGPPGGSGGSAISPSRSLALAGAAKNHQALSRMWIQGEACVPASSTVGHDQPECTQSPATDRRWPVNTVGTLKDRARCARRGVATRSHRVLPQTRMSRQLGQAGKCDICRPNWWGQRRRQRRSPASHSSFTIARCDEHHAACANPPPGY